MMRQLVGPIEKMKEPYILAKRYNWKGFLEFFLKHKELLYKQIDLHQSTPFHYAAHCGSSEMYNEMLASIDPKEMQHVLRMQDDMGNTPLHEVAFTGEVEMTKSILKKEEETMSEQFPKPLLELRNILGETPVYRAAALGKTNLINYFVQELGVDLRDHFHRTEDNKSILHTAVIDQFFGTALWLLKSYNELAYQKDENDLTTLQLLAQMPSAFRSQTQMGAFKNFIYPLLPDYQDYAYYLHDKDDTIKGEDLEIGQNGINEPYQTQWKQPPRIHHTKLSGFSWMWYTMWKALSKEWKGIEKLWRKKEMHNLVQELVHLLAKNDSSWQHSYIARDRPVVPMGRSHHIIEGKQKEKQEEKDVSSHKATIYTPLLMAACNGIIEIVEVIIHFHPQSIEHVSEDEQNILYMAVKHRQLRIFRMLKKLKIVRRLAGKIDKESNTVLHNTAEFKGGSQPGYALQLQEELHWFERIEKRLPYHYIVHKNNNDKTARELFEEKHEQLLKDAREWIKETAQSCSAVAVLVATVVFAAAYTVPGGTDDFGFPRLLHHPIFVVFTVMDVVALASSLASVVMFLSILTSPCELWDFRRSLPRKLMAGFAFLFFSMATTVLVFSATILVNIKLDNSKWTSSLTYCAAFFPVSIFAMMQFPLYVAMKGCVVTVFRKLKKIVPRILLNLIERSKRNRLWDI